MVFFVYYIINCNYRTAKFEDSLISPSNWNLHEVYIDLILSP